MSFTKSSARLEVPSLSSCNSSEGSKHSSPHATLQSELKVDSAPLPLACRCACVLRPAKQAHSCAGMPLGSGVRSGWCNWQSTPQLTCAPLLHAALLVHDHFASLACQCFFAVLSGHSVAALVVAGRVVVRLSRRQRAKHSLQRIHTGGLQLAVWPSHRLCLAPS